MLNTTETKNSKSINCPKCGTFIKNISNQNVETCVALICPKCGCIFNLNESVDMVSDKKLLNE